MHGSIRPLELLTVVGLSILPGACDSPRCPTGTTQRDTQCVSLDTADVADAGSIDDTPPNVRTPAAGGGGLSEGGRGASGMSGEAGAAGKELPPVAGAAGMDSPPPIAGAAGANRAGAGGVAAGAGGQIGAQAGAGVGAGAAAPTPTVPVPPACQASDEQCDNNDNDCDGKVDEGLIEGCDDANLLGECKPGRKTCSAGVWSACEGSVKPRAEACDAARLDENCDGSRNEGCGCVDGDTQDCGKDRGLCRPGTQSCMNGRWGPCVGAVDPQRKEACDEAREDEDCDGIANPSCDCIDGKVEACPVGSDTGECSRGQRTCRSGTWSVCSGARTAGDEVCNGLDDDCDGVIDDPPTNCASPNVCRSGRCVCVPTCGAQQCGADGCNGVCPYQCAQDQHCSGGRCVMDPTTAPSVYQPCSVPGNTCANSQFCTTFTLDQQAGTATRPVCSRGCVSDSDCPLAQGGSAHLSAACNVGWCLLLCDMTSSCPTGLTCQRVTQGGSANSPGRILMACLTP